MVVSITTNTTAHTALRALDQNARASAASLSKLAAGSRIVKASDDAASLAVGTKLRADVTALNVAQVNAGQASSLLQVADGAMAQTVDVLLRMKALATQAQSGSLSDQERGFLDLEFQQLGDHIDSIAEQTKFSGRKLLDGALDPDAEPDPGTPVAFQVGVASTDTITVPLPKVMLDSLGGPALPDPGTPPVLDTRTLADDRLGSITDSAPFVAPWSSTPPPNVFAAGEMGVNNAAAIYDEGPYSLTWQADVPAAGQTRFTLTNGSRPFTFEAASDTDYTTPAMVLTDGGGATVNLRINAPIDTEANGGGGANFAFSSHSPNRFTSGAMSIVEARAIGDEGPFVLAWNADTPGVGQTTFALTGGSRSFTVVENTPGPSYTNPTLVLTDAGTGETVTLAINTPLELDNPFRLPEQYTFEVEMAPGRANVRTQESAYVAGNILDTAIGQLNTFRSDTGALMSRFAFTADNLATTVENMDAARSVLLDVDLAAEMSNFTAKQVLLQASVAMLAQANQQPQQLLRLIQ